jgi:3-hydroxybutyryl-CoA dehydrogenase
LHELQESGQFDAAHQQEVLARLVGTASLSDLAESTLLIEAIPERLRSNMRCTLSWKR